YPCSALSVRSWLLLLSVGLRETPQCLVGLHDVPNDCLGARVKYRRPRMATPVLGGHPQQLVVGLAWIDRPADPLEDFPLPVLVWPAGRLVFIPRLDRRQGVTDQDHPDRPRDARPLHVVQRLVGAAPVRLILEDRLEAREPRVEQHLWHPSVERDDV